MASKNSYSDFKTFISKSVSEIDQSLKAAGYDMLTNDKKNAETSVNKIRTQVKVLEERSTEFINELQKGKNTLCRQLTAEQQKRNEMEFANKRLKTENLRLKEELDDSFPDVPDSQDSSLVCTSQEDHGLSDSQGTPRTSTSQEDPSPSQETSGQDNRK